jgi:hypothetical protein
MHYTEPEYIYSLFDIAFITHSTLYWACSSNRLVKHTVRRYEVSSNPASYSKFPGSDVVSYLTEAFRGAPQFLLANISLVHNFNWVMIASFHIISGSLITNQRTIRRDVIWKSNKLIKQGGWRKLHEFQCIFYLLYSFLLWYSYGVEVLFFFESIYNR